MSGKTKIWLCAAGFLVIIGLILFTVAMSLYNWDFNKLSTVKHEINTHEITEDFNELLINTTTSDIELVPSEDSSCKVICYETDNINHSVLVIDNKLTINANIQKNQFFNLNIGDMSIKITIYLPIKEEMTLNINTTTGDLSFENLMIKKINIKATTGDIYMKNISCDQLDLKLSTGKTTLSNVMVSGDFKYDATTGDLTFDSFDANNIYVEITTGDVSGTILTAKIFNIQTTTGKQEYPESYTGGICKISTTTGDVKLSFKK